MAHRPLEHSVEAAFVAAALRAGHTPLKFTSPGVTGVPDRIVLASGGRAAFAEIKRPGEKLRPLQQRVAKALRDLGFVVAEIDSVEAARAFFERWPG